MTAEELKVAWLAWETQRGTVTKTSTLDSLCRFVEVVILPRECQRAYELGFNRKIVRPRDAGWPRELPAHYSILTDAQEDR